MSQSHKKLIRETHAIYEKEEEKELSINLERNQNYFLEYITNGKILPLQLLNQLIFTSFVSNFKYNNF